jgi:hypothetical protein
VTQYASCRHTDNEREGQSRTAEEWLIRRAEQRRAEQSGPKHAYLLVEGIDILGLMERDQRLAQEVFVLVLERERKTVDDRSQDFQQLRHTVVLAILVHECVEDIVDRAANERAVGHELSVHAVQDRLQVVAFTRILRVEQRQELRPADCT